MVGGKNRPSKSSKRSNQRSTPPDDTVDIPLPPSSNDGGLKIAFEKQANSRIALLQEDESSHSSSVLNTNSTSSNIGTTNNQHPNKKIRLQNPPDIPSPSSSRTPDTHYSSNIASSSSYQVVGSSGGLKFTYESQSSATATSSSHPTLQTQQVVKESPPSSPGSDSGVPASRSVKRNRKASTNSNAPDPKETKLFQNGVCYLKLDHLLGLVDLN
jgi:hypothetical protein